MSKEELYYCHKCDKVVNNDFTFTKFNGNVIPVPICDTCGETVSVYSMDKEGE